MQAQVASVLDSLALTHVPPERQVARLRELAANAYRLSEVMHVPHERESLIGVAAAYAEVAEALERRMYPATRGRWANDPLPFAVR